MKKDVFSKIIHDVHAAVAHYYCDLAYDGYVRPNTLAHWNYVQNVKKPISYLVSKYMPEGPFSLLDAGCGNGQLFHLYAELGASTIAGIEISDKTC